MATIANLDVNLFARTAKFDGPIKKSQSLVTHFSSAARQTGSGLALLSSAGTIAAGAIAGIGAVAATTAAGVAALVSRAMSLNQEFQNFTRFGLQAESLTQFKLLANESAVELEKLVDTAKDLSIRIGEANLDGQGEIFESFQRLNLDVEQLAKQKPEEQLRSFAEAISQVSNETERLTLTDILLSDAGTDVLQLLEQGAGAFDRARDQAKGLGGLTSQDAANVRELSVNFGKLQIASENFFNLIAAKSAPTINFFIEGLNKGIEQGIQFTNTFFTAWAAGRLAIAETVKEILNQLVVLEGALEAISGIQINSGVDTLAAAARVAIDELTKQVNADIKKIKDGAGKKDGAGISGAAAGSVRSSSLAFGSRDAAVAFLAIEAAAARMPWSDRSTKATRKPPRSSQTSKRCCARSSVLNGYRFDNDCDIERREVRQRAGDLWRRGRCDQVFHCSLGRAARIRIRSDRCG